ncbi:MAG TPA: NUDIX domain-containing protein [Bacilli bacterium]|nr:NUDIX domain-containing protein [Bacilli bacterium]
MKNENNMPVGINPIILNDKGEILLGRRINKYGAGTYCFPGGRLQKGETFEQCIIRELMEETGLIIKEEDIEIINIANTIDSNNDTHYLQVGAIVKKYEGIPEIKEPDKCDDLRFFSLNNLPVIFKPNSPTIELYKKHIMYDKNLNVNE